MAHNGSFPNPPKLQEPPSLADLMPPPETDDFTVRTGGADFLVLRLPARRVGLRGAETGPLKPRAVRNVSSFPRGKFPCLLHPLGPIRTLIPVSRSPDQARLVRRTADRPIAVESSFGVHDPRLRLLPPMITDALFFQDLPPAGRVPAKRGTGE